jgi:hypothetical protein
MSDSEGLLGTYRDLQGKLRSVSKTGGGNPFRVLSQLRCKKCLAPLDGESLPLRFIFQRLTAFV